MGELLDGRRADIRSRGRPFTIKRGTDTATFTGFVRSFTVGELAGGFQQGDQRLETLVLPAPFTPPAKGDGVLIDGRRWTVMGVAAIYEGPTLIGYSISLRGG